MLIPHDAFLRGNCGRKFHSLTAVGEDFKSRILASINLMLTERNRNGSDCKEIEN